jgi:hypothetical protein
MTMPERHGPDLQTLLALFAPGDVVRAAEPVPGDQVPQPYQDLLVHKHHMTVTVEAHHGQLVDVKVLEVNRGTDSYARKILLALQGDGRIVQFGIARVNFQYCGEKVKEEILSEKIPLGRVLIQNGVLRKIEPTAYLRVTPGRDMMGWFGLAEPRITYGRLALIHCNRQPAVELLEIVAPE